MEPLYKYRPRTRLLETREVIRNSVVRAKPRVLGETYVELDTVAVAKVDRQVWSSDANMVNYAREAREGQETAGVVRIDVLSDCVVRVRYAEGSLVPGNATPMAVGSLPAPRRCTLKREKVNVAGARSAADGTEAAPPTTGEIIRFRTADVEVIIHCDPYRLEVRDLKGRILCGVGGPEKNHFGTWDAINTAICRTLDDGSPLAVESFDLAPDECLYGLGEQFHKLNKVGQTLDLMMQDGLGVFSTRNYKNVPFYVSTHGYGVFFNHNSLMTVWAGSASAADVRVAAQDEFLDYYLFFGSIKTVLSDYTSLTGKGVVPPAWTFGYWQAKFSYRSAEETLGVARSLRRYKVPCDVVHVDTDWFKKDWHCDLEFDPVDFPDPAGYFRDMKALGFNVSLWQMPYIKRPSRLFSDLEAVDGFVRRPDGGIYNIREALNEFTAVIDFTNPRAVDVFKRYCRDVLRLGAACIKTDFGEEAPLDGLYHDGRDGIHNHNLYPLLYNKAVFEVTREVHGDANGVVWARSAWAGNQRYPLHWGGDVSPCWEALGPQLAGGLSFGLSGYQFWSHDIGGFLGKTADHKLMVRWHQFGCFNSHARNHGCGEREIYKLPARYFKLCRAAIRLRYSLLPYILGQARRSVETSLPMLRALPVEFQDDPNTWNLADQYLFGEHLLVAPVFSSSEARRVYLPAGQWTDWWTGRVWTGPRWLSLARIPLGRFPLFIREGGVIAQQPVMNHVGERPVRKVTLRLAPFTGNGRTGVEVPVNDEVVKVVYTAHRGTHTVKTSPTDVTFSVVGIRGVKQVTGR